MGLNDTRNQAAPATTTTSQSTAGSFNMNTQTPAQEQTQAQQKWSFASVAGVGAPMGRNQTAEATEKVVKHLTELYAGVDGHDIKVLVMDANNTKGLVVSCVVVCDRLKDRKDSGVAYHTLVIEASHDGFQPRQETINGHTVEIVRPTSIAVDQRLAEKVYARVKQAYPNTNLFNTDTTVIPRTLSLEKADNLYPLARNTLTAVATELSIRTPSVGLVPMNLATGSFNNLHVSMQVENTTLAGDDGLPIRSDVVIEFSDNPLQKQQNDAVSVHDTDRSTKISRLAGFIDFAWNPVMDQNAAMLAAAGMINPAAMGGGLPTQKFAARLVVTNIESYAVHTTNSNLFSLIQSTVVGQKMNWVKAFIGTHTGRKSHDIGALNYDANLTNDPSGTGKLVTGTMDQTGRTEMLKFINMVVRDGITISVDVPDAGPTTWYTRILSEAMRGNQDARNALIYSFDELTNGAFSRHFTPAMPLFVDGGERIHLGYFQDENGVRRDLREIDYLCVATYKGATDIDTVRQWSDTFYSLGIDERERLDRRLRIAREIAPGLVVTDMADRVTFSKDLIVAATAAIAECGVRPTTNVNNGIDGLQSNRGVANFLSQGMLQTGTVGMFNAGGASIGAQQGFARSSFANRMF